MLRLETTKNIIGASGKASQIAIVDGRRRLTWADLEQRTRLLIAHFAPMDYRRVAYFSANRVELIPLMSAFATLGVPFVGIDYTSSQEYKTHCVQEIDANCIVCSEASRRDAEAIAIDLGIDTYCIDANPIMDQKTPYGECRILPRPFESIRAQRMHWVDC